MCLLKSWFFDIQKKLSQKLSMLEEKQGQFSNLHQIPHKTSNHDFRFSSYFLMMKYFQIKLQLATIFGPEKPEINKTKTIIENRYSKFC